MSNLEKLLAIVEQQQEQIKELTERVSELEAGLGSVEFFLQSNGDEEDDFRVLH